MRAKELLLVLFVLSALVYSVAPQAMCSVDENKVVGAAVSCCLSTGAMSTDNKCGFSQEFADLWGCSGNRTNCLGTSNFKYCNEDASDSTCTGAPTSVCVYQENEECVPF